MTPRFVRCAWVFAAMPVVLAVVCACSAPACAASAPKPGRGASVVIFPFENTGHAGEMDWLGEGLSELAIERLDGHGLTVFTREERLDALEKLGLPPTRISAALPCSKLPRKLTRIT